MATDRQHGALYFICDSCGEVAEGVSSDFHESWDDLKDEGWRAFKNKQGEWEHRCEECIRK